MFIIIVFWLSIYGSIYSASYSECAIEKEQCGIRQGRGCMDQVFAVRKVCEKYLANGKDVFYAFMGLEKAYDIVTGYHCLWVKLIARLTSSSLFKVSFFIHTK